MLISKYQDLKFQSFEDSIILELSNCEIIKFKVGEQQSLG